VSRKERGAEENMKAIKIIGAIFGILGLAVAVLYIGWLSPPSGDAVCGNVAKIMKKEIGKDMSDKEKSECVARAEKAPEFGRAVWVKNLKCMRDADTAKDLETCGGK